MWKDSFFLSHCCKKMHYDGKYGINGLEDQIDRFIFFQKVGIS